MRIDLSKVDIMYQKWIEQDNSLGDMLNAKMTKQLNNNFRLKQKTWKLKIKDR